MGTLLKYIEAPGDLSFEEAQKVILSLKMVDFGEMIQDQEDMDQLQKVVDAGSMAILTVVYMAAAGGAEESAAALRLVRSALQIMFQAGWREGVWHDRHRTEEADSS